jgi:hypothetical protein
MIEREFIEPVDWSTREMYDTSMRAEFRSRAVSRLNEILDRNVITDVFIYSVSRK